MMGSDFKEKYDFKGPAKRENFEMLFWLPEDPTYFSHTEYNFGLTSKYADMMLVMRKNPETICGVTQTYRGVKMLFPIRKEMSMNDMINIRDFLVETIPSKDEVDKAFDLRFEYYESHPEKLETIDLGDFLINEAVHLYRTGIKLLIASALLKAKVLYESFDTPKPAPIAIQIGQGRPAAKAEVQQAGVS